MRRNSLLLLCLVLLTACGAADASAAARPRHHIGALPGFPRIRGVVPVLGSPAALDAHEKLVQKAFRAAQARILSSSGMTLSTPMPSSETPGAGCPELFAFTQDVCYQGGPVLRNPVVHLIFWEGPVNVKGEPTTSKVDPFPAGYEATVERYFEDVTHDSGLTSNVFSVDPQYGDGEGEGEYKSTFQRAGDVAQDIEPFPTHSTLECSDLLESPCVLDQDVQTQVEKAAEAHGWDSESLQDIFFVFTAPGVGSCTAEGACAYEAYCAYHSDFGGTGEYLPPGNETIYANMPFPLQESGCDAGAHPNSPTDNGADAVIDNASHEFNEAITDPLGSQCNALETVCEPFSWTDAIGQEIADKCLPPETTIAGIYGEPLGGTTASTVYNQLINDDHYFTQRVWSNDAGRGEGACVQRIVNAAFTSERGQATVPVRLDGSSSGSAGDEISYWEWNFGDGTIVASPEPTISHTYSKAGEYQVTLTAFDVYGNANIVTQTVTIGPHQAPKPIVPVEESNTTTTTVTTTTSTEPPLAHISAEALAKELGLPRSGAKLPGSASITLGRAMCPPTCGLTALLYASVTPGKGRHRGPQKRLIGSLRLTLTANASKQIALKLNSVGRSMLRSARKLKVTLKLNAEDQQGASWKITRSLTLTSSPKASGRAR